MTEPARDARISTLWKPFAARVIMLLERLKDLGFDPIVFEAKRSEERQKWLYGIGRTHDLNRKPVTWTMNSRHLVGKGVDIISKSRLWDHPKFFTALDQEARKLGLKTLKVERCHVEWKG